MLSRQTLRTGSLSLPREHRRLRHRSVRTRLILGVEALEARQLLSGLVVDAGNPITTTAGATVTFQGSVSGGTAPYLESWNFGDGTSMSAGGSGGASFAGSDGATQGNWIGKYGSAGYDLPGIATSLPSYAAVTPSGQYGWTWASPTTDPRALEVPGGTSRTAACWYSSTSFSVGVNLTDGQVHPVSLYAVDYDSAVRSEQIQVIDAATGAVLDTESLSNFHGGEYLTWDVSGDVTFELTHTAGANAVLSGLFIGNMVAPTAIQHVYANPGTYTATLSATDSTGATGSGSTTVTVADVAPTVSLTAPSSGTAGSVGTPVPFAAAATDISPAVQAAGFTYNWNFGDGASGTGADPSHTYAAAGNYTVSVTSTDENGDTSTPASATLTVNAPVSALPKYQFDFGPAGSPVPSGYIGLTTNAYSTTTGYGWKNGSTVWIDGAWWPNRNPVIDYYVESTDNTFVINLPNGTYTVVPTLGSFAKPQSQISIWLNGQQAASGLTTAPEQFVSPAYSVAVTTGQLAVHLANMSASSTTVPWFYLDALSILPGQVQPPTANAGPPLMADAGSPITFSQATAGGAGSLNDSWYFGDSTSSTATVLNPIYTYRTAGTYSALLTVTDADGLVVGAPVAVTVNPAPAANAGSPITMGAGSTVTFSQATESGGTGTLTPSWNFGDGSQISGILNPSHSYPNPGTYTATLSVTDAIEVQGTSTTTVIVNDVAPVVSMAAPTTGMSGLRLSFAAIANDISPAVQASGYTYKWDFGDGGTASGNDATHVFGEPGTFNVTVTATDEYGSVGTATGTIVIGESMATTYSLAAPSPADCAIGLSSGMFTLALPYGQFVSAPVTVNLSDGGKQGIFSPQSVILSNASPTATFTYMAANAGTISISASNQAGLINPTLVTITAQNPVTTYSVTGPASGTVATTKTFTVTVGAGWLTNPVQITPSVSGVNGASLTDQTSTFSDGTFSPSTITLSSANPSATFTYTPQLYGSQQITFTNNSGLSDSSPISFLAEVQLGSSGTAPSGNQAPDLGGFNFFANGAWWQAIGTQASSVGVAPNSSSLMSGFGSSQIRIDWSTTTANGGNSLYGMPYNVVPGEQPLVPIEVSMYPTPGETGPVPFFPGMSIEGTQGAPYSYPTPNDQHALVMVRNETTGGIAYLDEGWKVGVDPATGGWESGSLGMFNMLTGAPPPEFAATTDAAGLPISPLLVNYSEAALAASGGPVIDHPFRVCISSSLSLNALVWPARHGVYTGSNSSGLPMGARLQLSPDWYTANIGKFDPIDRAVVTAMYQYGVIVADLTTGGGLWLEGVNDQRWTTSELGALASIPDSAFQVLDTIHSPLNLTAPASGPVGVPQTLTLNYSIAGDSNFKADVYVYMSSDGGSTWQCLNWTTLSDSFRGPFDVTFTPQVAGTYLFKVGSPEDWIMPPQVTFTATSTQATGAVSTAILLSFSTQSTGAINTAILTPSSTSTGPVAMMALPAGGDAANQGPALSKSVSGASRPPADAVDRPMSRVMANWGGNHGHRHRERIESPNHHTMAGLRGPSGSLLSQSPSHPAHPRDVILREDTKGNR